MGYPNFPQFPNPPMGAQPLPNPGHIPLRPLAVGDLFGAGLAMVWRHFALIAPIGVVIATLSSAVDLAIIQATGMMHAVASGAWVDDLLNNLQTGRTGSLPTGIYVATIASSLVTLAGVLLLSGVLSACAGADAVQRTPPTAAITGRLRASLWATLTVSVIVAASILLGSFLLIVPGVLAFATWALAAPVAVMEHATPGAALARSARLSRGNRWRILGVSLLIAIITVAIESVASSVAVALVPSLSDVAAVIVGNVATVVVSAITLPWIGAVIALLYVDIRLRRENLGPALRAHAARLA